MSAYGSSRGQRAYGTPVRHAMARKHKNRAIGETPVPVQVPVYTEKRGGGKGKGKGDGKTLGVAAGDDSNNAGDDSSIQDALSNLMSNRMYIEESQLDVYQASVVKITVVSQEADYTNPWQSQGTEKSQGSGVLTEFGILTSAHVVADATFIEIQKITNPQTAVATVAYISHESDLALLTVEEKGFFADIPVAKLADAEGLPSLRERVSCVGFPVGGDELSITDGVVSRVEVQPYAHSGRVLLAITIDAAINPGNSGGPIFNAEGSAVIGIAMQAMDAEEGQNVGEIVPAPIIHHFLTSFTRGLKPEIPFLGFEVQNMEGPALRRFKGMKADETGVLVRSITHGGSADGILKVGDVVLAVAGEKINNNMTVRYQGKYRTYFSVVVQKYFVGDKLPLHILRDGSRIDVTLVCKGQKSLVGLARHEAKPDYYIFGGLVFQPLETNLLETFGPAWQLTAPDELLRLAAEGRPTPECEEIVVFTTVLADTVNVGYGPHEHSVVATVNGSQPRNLRDFVALVEAVPPEGRINIVTSKGVLLTFDVSEAQARLPLILKRYSVASDRSVSLEDTRKH